MTVAENEIGGLERNLSHQFFFSTLESEVFDY